MLWLALESKMVRYYASTLKKWRASLGWESLTRQCAGKDLFPAQFCLHVQADEGTTSSVVGSLQTNPAGWDINE